MAAVKRKQLDQKQEMFEQKVAEQAAKISSLEARLLAAQSQRLEQSQGVLQKLASQADKISHLEQQLRATQMQSEALELQRAKLWTSVGKRLIRIVLHRTQYACSPQRSSAENIGDLQRECVEDHLQLLGREGIEFDDLFLALGLYCHLKHRAALNRTLLTGEKPEQFMLAALSEDLKGHGLAHVRLAEEAERTVELLYLKVRGGSSKQGVASMLLKEVHTYCSRNGLDVRLDVLGTNEKAISLYRRHNFKPIARRPMMVDDQQVGTWYTMLRQCCQ